MKREIQWYHGTYLKYGWMLTKCSTYNRRDWLDEELMHLIEDNCELVQFLWNCTIKKKWPYTVSGMNIIFLNSTKNIDGKNISSCYPVGVVPIGFNMSDSKWDKYILTPGERRMSTQERHAYRQGNQENFEEEENSDDEIESDEDESDEDEEEEDY